MTVQSVPGAQTVKSWPATREIHVARSQINVTSLPEEGKGFPTRGPTTPLNVPAASADDFTVLGAIAREWTVDLLVRLKPAVDGDPVQVWRLSPDPGSWCRFPGRATQGRGKAARDEGSRGDGMHEPAVTGPGVRDGGGPRSLHLRLLVAARNPGVPRSCRRRTRAERVRKS